MSETLKHPDHERLQAYVAKELDGGGTAVVEAHLTACARCRVEVEELHSLFAMLSSLAYHSPAAGFADRVMAGVRVRQPWFARAAEWLAGLAPKSTRAWALTTAMVALPAAVTTALLWWLMSRPGVTVQGLWVISTEFTARALGGAWSWAWSYVAGSALASWAAAAAEIVASVGRGGIGLGVVMFATLTAASIWILYQNLFRTDARRTDYASFVF